MHPTVDEQLTAIRRLIEAVTADPTLAETSARMLADATSQLRRLAGSWGGRFAFLQRDNADAVTMLRLLADHLGPWTGELDTLHARAGLATSESQAHDVNKTLRALLARAARELPDTEAARAGRAALSAYLRDRVATDPALNRNPTRPTP